MSQAKKENGGAVQSSVENVPLSERHLIGEKAVEDFSSVTYEYMPVEKFGNFLIKKMGYDEKVGIGKTNQIVRPIEFVPRQHRQGLGADPMPSILQKQKGGKALSKELQHLVSKSGKNYNYIGDKMIDLNKPIEVNDSVNVIAGKHSGLEGVVTRIDREKEECLVELKHGQSVKVDLAQIKLKHPSQQQESKRGGSDDDEDDNSDSDSNSRSQSSDSLQEKKGKTIKKKDKKKDKKKKDRKKDKKKAKRLTWALPSIRVRIINKKYRDGKFYNVKGVITDLLDLYTFTLLTPSKDSLEDLREKDIETVIPELGKFVKVVEGKHKDKIGTLLERNKRKNEVVVQLRNDMSMVTLTQDEISELA